MHVVPYNPAHRDELRSVCLANAGEQARSDKTHAQFTLLMYCDPYLEHGVAYMLVDDDDVAHGYVFACEDWSRWTQNTASYRRQIEALGPAYRALYAAEATFYASVAGEYPAHLHIDIEEPYTGGSNGRKLMEALLERLRADDVRGVVLGVEAANKRAVGFYRHLGFEKLSEYDQGRGFTFCMRLDG